MSARVLSGLRSGLIGGVIGGLAAGLAAGPAAGLAPPEQVRLEVPAAVVFPVTDLHAKAAVGSTLLTFDHVRLAPGSRLRISVRSEGPDPGTGAPARISYTARADGGTPFGASLRATDYTPVFESDPAPLAGRVEIAWTLEPLGRIDRSAGRTLMRLRWKVESIPGPRETGASRRPAPLAAVPGFSGQEGAPSGFRRRPAPAPAVPRLAPPG
jgi:hypothetical protein